MSFILYLTGFLLIIAGTAWALVLFRVSTIKIVIVCMILLGIGILKGVTRTRPKDTR